MTRYRDDGWDHYGSPPKKKVADPSAQFAGLPLLDQDPEPERARLEREDSIDARFQLFHRDHPEVLADLERMVQEELDGGARRSSVRTLLAVLRSQRRMALNDQFSSRYARLIIERHPQWRDALETRPLRSA